MEGVVALITAFVLLAAALVGLFVKVQQVHVLVNDRMTEAVDRIAQLTEALVGADVTVPPKDSSQHVKTTSQSTKGNPMSAFFNRLANEPALVVAAVLAVAALFGQDLTEFSGFIESAVVIVAGFVTRHFVTPTRTL